MRRGIKHKLIKIFASFAMICALFLPLEVAAAEQQPVAINGVGYDSLEEAVTHAVAGDTIMLTQDLDLTHLDSYVFSLPENATLDLNRHTITARNMGAIYMGTNLTIKNGTFVTPAGHSYALFVGDEADSDNIVLEDIVSDGGINVYNATNVTLKNVSATAHNYYAVWADAHAMVTIKSGKYSSGAKGADVLGISTNGGSYIHIDGGDFTVENGGLALGGEYTPPVIYGGTFNVDPSAYVAEGAKVTQNASGLYEVGFETKVDFEEVDPDKVVTAPEIGASDAEAAKAIILGSLSPDLAGRTNIDVQLKVDPTEADESTKTEFAEAAQNISPAAKVTNYFDIVINVVNADTGSHITTLSELKDELQLTVLLPESLQNQDPKINRRYYVLRKHDGKIDTLDARLASNGKSLTFFSDEFSLYAIAYADSPKTPSGPGGTTGPGIGDSDDDHDDKEDDDRDDSSWTDIPSNDGVKLPVSDETITNPDTGDRIIHYFVMFFCSAVGLTTIAIYYLKNRKNI